MQTPQDKKRNLFIKSYGCQMNEYDSERMAEILEKHNYSSVDEPNVMSPPVRAKIEAVNQSPPLPVSSPAAS